MSDKTTPDEEVYNAFMVVVQRLYNDYMSEYDPSTGTIAGRKNGIEGHKWTKKGDRDYIAPDENYIATYDVIGEMVDALLEYKADRDFDESAELTDVLKTRVFTRRGARNFKWRLTMAQALRMLDLVIKWTRDENDKDNTLYGDVSADLNVDNNSFFTKRLRKYMDTDTDFDFTSIDVEMAYHLVVSLAQTLRGQKHAFETIE